MKKLTIIFAIILCTITLNAQNQNVSIVPEEGDICSVVSGHSVSASLISLEYAYEYAFSNKATVVFRAGFPYVMTDYYYEYDEDYGTNTQFEFEPSLGITIEPRYYTNMERRAINGKFTGNNCANFWSVRGIVYPAGRHTYVTAIPMYGIRRGSDHWFREWTFGVGYHGMYRGFLPHVNFRLGYTF